ncbi:MAG: SdpI family protein [Kiritimatiellia bacterium]
MMFIVCLFVLLSFGVAFALGGLAVLCFPPKHINSFYGYRTSRSCKSQRNWDFAQRHCARMMVWTGAGHIAVSGVVFAVFVLVGYRDATLCKACAALELGLMVPALLLPILSTEKALKRWEAQDAEPRV